METGGERLSNRGYGLAGEEDEALKNSWRLISVESEKLLYYILRLSE